MSCVVPANQPIYQALVDKAASYPADKPYQAKAYKNAAETVLSHNKNLYTEYVNNRRPRPLPANFGPKTEDFICDFIKANPKPTSMWEQLKEIVTPELYTNENPRRSTRLTAKAPARKPVAKPVPKPVALPAPFNPARYFPEEKKVSTAVGVISTYGADDGYERNGYELYRVKDKFEIICVDHCSCFDTVKILEGYDEDAYEHTVDDIIRLATAKSDPRVPDVVTEDPYLIALYTSILEHKNELLTWNPTQDEESLDAIEVCNPHYKYKF